ncbi:MAG TPA: hypothetical protein VEA59_01755, partial [Patescibacteria group bacterium]|nr:hypothetical protein [Patescibacteria group bacterium]
MPRIVYKLLPYAATLLLGFGLVALVRPYYGLLRYNVMHALDFMADTSVSRAAEPVLLRGEDKGIPTYNAPAHITPTFAYEVNTKANLLSIPSIGIDSEVFEGRTESTLLKGIWRIPTTSTPDKGGNT